MPHHAVRLAKLRSLIGSLIIQQYQFVTDNDREEWEKYAFENEGWVLETLENQRNDPHFQGVPQSDEFMSSTSIHYGFDGDTPPNTGPYAPTWQSYPLASIGIPLYNWNTRQHPTIRPAIERVIRDKAVVITEVINMPNPDDPASEVTVNRTNDFILQFTGSDEDPTEPFVRYGVRPVLI